MTNIISRDLKLNMKSMSLESNEGIFEGIVKVLIKDQEQLNKLIDLLKNIDGVISINRVE
jgi:guanosine-3',5'-bis(diphosphate) 3'-pyrophosphohydrolase